MRVIPLPDAPRLMVLQAIFGVTAVFDKPERDY